MVASGAPLSFHSLLANRCICDLSPSAYLSIVSQVLRIKVRERFRIAPYRRCFSTLRSLHASTVAPGVAQPAVPLVSTTDVRGETIMKVFDRKTKLIQRERMAAEPDGSKYDYLKSEIAYRVADRVKDVSRKFENALEIGSGKGLTAPHIYSDMVGKLYQMDSCKSLLDQSKASPEVETIKLHADEEAPLPFEPNTLDLVLSNLSLHWVNNLPGVFRNIFTALKPDGCFIGAMFGGETLFELRCSLQLGETEREGGFAPHISPFTSIRDLGNLLNRAGFNLLTIDIDEMVVTYPTMFELMWDLKGMGENNSAWSRKLHLNRDSMLAAASIYRENYGGKDGNVPATFQILYMIGWKPHPSQAKPAARGTGQVSLKDIHKLDSLKKKPKA